jgi:hypothetical protein
MSVRLALGQVLDYGCFGPGSRFAVLLPEAPAADLIELLDRYGVRCVVETTPNEFLDRSTYNRVPIAIASQNVGGPGLDERCAAARRARFW